MKNLLIALFVSSAALVPATVHSAPASQTSRSEKKYGGFKAGDKFTLRVTDVDIVKIGGKRPDDIPHFNKGDRIRFTIGKKGQLTGSKDIRLDFDDSTRKRNDYEKIRSNPTKLSGFGYINKTQAGNALRGKLTFTIVSFDNFFPTRYRVTYTLKR
ncbi:MAG: hypothetical protein EOP85_03450 [Verrucomicrobiaceae bacterium]|nr:MAG: hypothetical protein EOP85_03450 [Verrucomicrobiaceae bacterium]